MEHLHPDSPLPIPVPPALSGNPGALFALSWGSAAAPKKVRSLPAGRDCSRLPTRITPPLCLAAAPAEAVESFAEVITKSMRAFNLLQVDHNVRCAARTAAGQQSSTGAGTDSDRFTPHGLLAQGIVVFASPSSYNVSSVMAERLIGTELWAMVHPSEVEALQAYFRSKSHLVGSRVQFLYRRCHSGAVSAVAFQGEWQPMPGSAGGSLHLVGFEKRMRGPALERRMSLDAPIGPVVMSGDDPLPDMLKDDAAEQREKAKREKQLKDLEITRKAVQAAYVELTNAIHVVNTVGLSMREVLEAAVTKPDGFTVEDPMQMHQDVNDLIAASKRADFITREIQALERVEAEPESAEPFAVRAELCAIVNETSLLASEGERCGMVLIIDPSIPDLPTLEGNSLRELVRSAIVHALRQGTDDRVIVMCGVPSSASSRLVVEVLSRNDSTVSLDNDRLQAELTASSSEVMSDRGSKLVRNAHRLSLFMAVAKRLVKDMDAEIDMNLRPGLFRFALSVPWQKSKKENAMNLKLEKDCRLKHAEGCKSADALRFVTGLNSGLRDDGPRVLHLSKIPAEMLSAELARDFLEHARVPTLVGDLLSADLAASTPSSSHRGLAAASSPGTNRAPARSREGREKRRREREAERERKTGKVVKSQFFEDHPEFEVLKGKHVLLVDDMSMVQRKGERMLETLGCTCDVREDGDEIEEALKTTKVQYDMVLLDIVMTRVNGEVMCSRMRNELGFRNPIVAMTGHTDPGRVTRYYQIGFDVVLAKPFSIIQLATALIEGVQRRGGVSRIKRVAAVMEESGEVAALGGSETPGDSGEIRPAPLSSAVESTLKTPFARGGNVRPAFSGVDGDEGDLTEADDAAARASHGRKSTQNKAPASPVDVETGTLVGPPGLVEGSH
jgi:CheY-like chemotaxis protein